MKAFSAASLLKPSLADILLIALLAWVLAFTIGAGNAGLLFDSSVGLHVRYGDLQRAEGHVPPGEPWSYTNPQGPLVRWEWLAENLYSRIHEVFGLRGLILLAAGLIVASLGLSLRRMMDAGASALVGIFVVHMGIAVSSVHFLARPLVFTFFLLNVSMWMLERDRASGGGWQVWLLLPVTALWANLHGGYLGLVVTLGAMAAGQAIELLVHRNPAAGQAALRYAGLTVGSLAATLVNPYGWKMLGTELDYLRADWPLKVVQEYHRPDFTSAAGIYLTLLLALGLFTAIRLIRRHAYGNALLLLGWGYAASTSIRHAPIFFFVTAPLLASEVQMIWNRLTENAPRKSVLGILGVIAREHTPALSRNSVWPALVVAALLFTGSWLPWPTDFPASQNPVNLARRHREQILRGRTFTTDLWSSYLLYHDAPRFRYFLGAFVNAYHKDVTDQYMRVIAGDPGWEQLLVRYQVATVLVPTDSGLAAKVRKSADWTIVDEDGTALLATRRVDSLKEAASNR